MADEQRASLKSKAEAGRFRKPIVTRNHPGHQILSRGELPSRLLSPEQGSGPYCTAGDRPKTSARLGLPRLMPPGTVGRDGSPKSPESMPRMPRLRSCFAFRRTGLRRILHVFRRGCRVASGSHVQPQSYSSTRLATAAKTPESRRQVIARSSMLSRDVLAMQEIGDRDAGGSAEPRFGARRIPFRTSSTSADFGTHIFIEVLSRFPFAAPGPMSESLSVVDGASSQTVESRNSRVKSLPVSVHADHQPSESPSGGGP